MVFSGGSQQAQPDDDQCELDTEEGKFQCEFANKNENGEVVQVGQVEVRLDENGNPVGKSHTFQGGWSEEEKEELMDKTWGRAKKKGKKYQGDGGALAGHTD